MRPGGNRTHAHEWGPWKRGRTKWHRTCPDCGRVEREDRSEDAVGIADPAQRIGAVIIEDPPPAALRAVGESERQAVMYANPGQWIRWKKGVKTNSSVPYLRSRGFEAVSQRMPDGTFTVWSRLPDSSG